MNHYKEKLKLDNKILIAAAVVMLLFSILSILAECRILDITPQTGDSHWQSRWRGFVCGLSCSMAAFFLYSLYRNTQALKDEQKLKQLYIKENDERETQVCTYARSSAMSVFTIGGLAVVVISGYFSVPVSLTVLACVLASSLLGVTFKLYYRKKF